MNPINIGSRRELFVDSYLIENLTGLELRLQKPQPAGISLRFDRSWEGRYCGYVTVIKDHDVYRMYYRGWPDPQSNGDNSDNQVTCYAESPDGVNWEKPDLGLVDIEGTYRNNVILAGNGHVSHNFTPFIDRKPGIPTSERFKAIAGTAQTGVLTFASADGIRWRQSKERPILPPSPDEIRYDSQNLAFWSDAESCYVCYFRVFRNGIRTVARTTSKDFDTWSEPVLVRLGEGPPEHLYTSQIQPYFRAPHIYIAFPARFLPGKTVLTDEEGEALEIDRYPSSKNNGRGRWFDISETLFMSSRSRDRFDRTFMQGFVRPGADRRNWVGRSNFAALGVVPTGPREMSMYVTRGFSQPTHHLERLSLRTDGITSLSAPYNGGEMVTKLILFNGRELELNYETGADGHITVEMLNERNEPVVGCTKKDAIPNVGDEIVRIARWKEGADVRRLANTPVRLRFFMKDADLYSFRFR